MRHLIDFVLGSLDLTAGVLFFMRGRPFIAGVLGCVGGALMVATLAGAR